MTPWTLALTDCLMTIPFVMAMAWVWSCIGRAIKRMYVTTSEGEVAVTSGLGWAVMTRGILLWASIVLVAIGLSFFGWLAGWKLIAGLTIGWTLLDVIFYCVLSECPELTYSFGGMARDVRCSKTGGLAPFRYRNTGEVNSAARTSWVTKIWLTLLLAICIAQTIGFGLMQFPMDWDTLAYHAPFIDHWLQTGTLTSQRCAFWYMPGNLELLGLTMTGVFSGDFLAQSVNLFVMLMLLAAIDHLGHLLSWSIWCRLTVMTLTLGNTVMVRQLVSLENDLAVAATFIVGLTFVIRFVQQARTIDLALAAIATGVCGGVKYYALGYAAVLVIVIFMAVLWARTHQLSRLVVVGKASLYVMCSLGALTGYWYVRNWIITGSPIYPQGIAMLGIEAPWNEIRPEISTSTVFFGLNKEVFSNLVWAWWTQCGPLGMVAMFCSLPLAIAALIYSLKLSQQPLLLIAIATVGTAVVYLITPNVIETDPGTQNMLKMQYHSVRFGYAAFVMAVVCGGAVVHQFADRFAAQRRLMMLGQTAFAGLALLSLGLALAPQYGWRQSFLTANWNAPRHWMLDWNGTDWLLLTMNVMLLIAIANFFRDGQTKEFSRATKLKIAWLASFVSGCVAIYFLSHHWHTDHDSFYNSFNTSCPADLIQPSASQQQVCVCTYLYYPLLGSHREKDVVRPGIMTNSAEFQRYLEKYRISLVAAPDSDWHWSQTYAENAGWLANSDVWQQVHERAGFKIYLRK